LTFTMEEPTADIVGYWRELGTIEVSFNDESQELEFSFTE
jgi:hypothetical protein